MKALKALAYGLAGLVALAVLGAAVAAFVVDGAFVKARLERAMKERNRTLSIEGTPTLRLFPVAGLALGKTVLSEAGSSQPFVTLERAEVAGLEAVVEVDRAQLAQRFELRGMGHTTGAIRKDDSHRRILHLP